MTLKIFKHIVINEENFEEQVKPLIAQIRPNWNTELLKFKKFYNGISNLLYGVFVDDVFTTTTDMVLVRIDGKPLFDRDVEMENMVALSKINLAAQVFAKFANGCSYQYIHGTMLNIEQMRDDFYISLVIKEFAKLHSSKLDLNRQKDPFIFSKMKEIAHLLPDELDDPEKNAKYLLHFPKRSVVFEEIECLEKHLAHNNYPIAFCHNDVLVNNLIMNLKKDRIHFIDFEYSGYNYCAFDIGNHFNEFAGLDNVDYSLYPDELVQKRWIRQYLEARISLSGRNGYISYEIEKNIDNEVDKWYKMINKFSLVSHLIWSIWSILQDNNMSIKFDYIGYAISRWNEYKKRKNEFLALL